ncbi:hypothetical protein [Candidatus Liberibacter solanacearum]|uniref:Uncharacterized protein n=1 Tax=Candidatus Liberibacter solanacearum TaxID=556287 RepID=A0A1V2N6X5_9HYPH|nr:hypothetical protein [Candidatus Liberibacter solanacearum]ONI58462.1 hypothetical protein AYO25_05360 [Candidatus Liberibacter solanacearum]ONI58996.1 hypothetical protein AYJ09_01005 [Candidatus Liberibacter solanacearum]
MSLVMPSSTQVKYSEKNKLFHQDISLQRLYKNVLIKDFSKHGRKVVKNLRKEKPEQYLRLIAQILPKENMKEEETINGDPLTDEQLCEIIRSLEKELQLVTDSKNQDVCPTKVKKTT